MGKNKDKRQKAPATPTDKKNEHALAMRRIGEQYKTARILGVWLIAAGTFCFACYCFTRAVEAAAGKQTDFNAVLRGVASLDLSRGAAYALAVIFGGTAYYNYRGRKKAEKAAGRAAKLEQEVDPKRTGSGLLEDGGNPEEDAL